jgi:T-complex protein 1 subunit beta
VRQLRACHATPGSTMGIDVLEGTVGCMAKNGIFESFRVKQQILLSATEAAEMIMRVDDIVKCAPRQRQ